MFDDDAYIRGESEPGKILQDPNVLINKLEYPKGKK